MSSPNADPSEVWSFGLSQDAWGRLVLIDAEGKRHQGVEPSRAFPLSEPRRWISLRDSEAHEIAFIDDLNDLPPELAATLEDELSRREFVPLIRKIHRAPADVMPSEWQVETDRGPTHFTVQSDDDIRLLGPFRALITDIHGLRYLVPDTRELDSASRGRLERFL